jgi:hypothetical protein
VGADRLWVAVPEGGESLAIRALLGHIRPSFPSAHQLNLDLPSDTGEQALRSVGFYPYQTLIWMELGLR